jgi:hypothetical protein
VVLVLIVARVVSSVFGVIADPPSILLLTSWLTVILFLFSLLGYLSDRFGFPIIGTLTMAAVLLAFFDLTDNHQVRAVGARASTSYPQEVGPAFDGWIEARREEVNRFKAVKRPYPVLLFVAEGGGARAAFMTALVLEQFRIACPNLLRHTFAVIGVSGGSLGAMLASAAIKQEGNLGTDCSVGLTENGPVTQATEAGGVDMLRPLLRGTLFADAWMRVLPFGVVNLFHATGLTGPWLGAADAVASVTDRAQYLEHGIDVAWRAYAPDGQSTLRLDYLPFGDLWSGPAGAPPALALLTTDVDTGRRVAVSHLKMRGGTAPPPADGCVLLNNMDESPASRARVVTLAELAPSLEVPTVTAAILSARFPGLTPAGTVPCSDHVHRLVDGGYFENSGLTTAAELVGELRQKAASESVALILVQIENSRASTDWRFATGRPPAKPSRSASELLSPVRAITGTRQARADLARVAIDQLFNEAPASCAGQKCLISARFELRPCRTPVPLGWSLSDEARNEIRRQLFSLDATGQEPACVTGRPADAPLPTAGRPNSEVFRELIAAIRLPQ